MKSRLVDFNKWKDPIYNWAQNINAKFTISRNVSMGMMGESYTIEIEYKQNNLNPIIISQNGSGSKFEVVPQFVIIKYIDNHLIDFNLSLYQKSFIERIFNQGNVKTGNKNFDKKYGVYTSDKTLVTKLFSEKRIQEIFLKNNLLILNAQKDNSTILIKNMELKLRETIEFQRLLDDFIFILEFLKKYK